MRSERDEKGWLYNDEGEEDSKGGFENYWDIPLEGETADDGREREKACIVFVVKAICIFYYWFAASSGSCVTDCENDEREQVV